MVRISDARMSGTAFGTTVLHVAPESTVGRTAGARPDRRLDHARRARPPAHAERRRRRARPPAGRVAGTPPVADRGWYRLYIDHVTQADTGCDLDFLVGASGSTILRESH